MTNPGYLALGDGAIADAFTMWLTYAEQKVTRPWFCAASFINPHDMSTFPYGYGLAGLQSATLGDFGSPSQSLAGYVPPPTGGYPPPAPHLADETIVAQTTLYQPNGTAPVGPPPSNQPWNGIYADAPSQLQYGPSGTVYGKPSLQLVYQNNSAHELGSAENPNAWFTFLNYYFWIQANVDVQVGRVLIALSGSSFAKKTVVMFLSDHGDYAGSHWIHGKAFAIYDETINVPLYIQIPGQTALTLPYVCSSVDILPFLYTVALGNASWRTNSTDLVGYLYNREAITDFIYSSSPTQHRLTTTIKCASPNENGAGEYQPYILHTTDEGFTPFTNPSNGSPVASHAIGFRSVDYSLGSSVPYGGGKLGTYSFWNYTLGDSDGVAPTQPDTNVPKGGGPQQFEFYNYSFGQTLSANYGEIGNQVSITNLALTGESLTYQQNFNAIVNSELYTFSMPNGASVPAYISGPSGAYNTALNTYLDYVQSQAGQTTTDTTWQK